MLNKTKKFLIIEVLTVLIILIATGEAYAIGFASSIGTVDHTNTAGHTVTTTGLINTSKNYYLGLRIFSKCKYH